MASRARSARCDILGPHIRGCCFVARLHMAMMALQSFNCSGLARAPNSASAGISRKLRFNQPVLQLLTGLDNMRFSPKCRVHVRLAVTSWHLGFLVYNPRMAMISRATGHQEGRGSINDCRNSSICCALLVAVEQINDLVELLIRHVHSIAAGRSRNRCLTLLAAAGGQHILIRSEQICRVVLCFDSSEARVVLPVDFADALGGTRREVIHIGAARPRAEGSAILGNPLLRTRSMLGSTPLGRQ